MGGQIQVLFTGAPTVSSPTRLAALPDLPTVAEADYKYFEADQWYGVVAPAGAPREIVNKLNAQINQSLRQHHDHQRL